MRRITITILICACFCLISSMHAACLLADESFMQNVGNMGELRGQYDKLIFELQELKKQKEIFITKETCFLSTLKNEQLYQYNAWEDKTTSRAIKIAEMRKLNESLDDEQRNMLQQIVKEKIELLIWENEIKQRSKELLQSLDSIESSIEFLDRQKSDVPIISDKVR